MIRNDDGNLPLQGKVGTTCRYRNEEGVKVPRAPVYTDWKSFSVGDVVPIHPGITKDIGDRVKRGTRICNRMNVNCSKLLLKMPIFDIQRLSLVGFLQLKHLSKTHS